MFPREALVRTDYLRSFPDLIGSIHGFDGGTAEHAALLRTLEQGDDWSASLEPTDLVLLPAACYPVYPTLTGELPDGGRLFDVLGTCFRHEPSDDPARMQSFHQHEQTGRTRDRTRPMLQQRQKALAMAPSTRDPKRT